MQLNLTDAEFELICAAVAIRLDYWETARPSRGFPQSVIDRQIKAWSKLYEKLRTVARV